MRSSTNISGDFLDEIKERMMTQQDRLNYLIKYLILENRRYENIEIPNSEII